MIFNSKPFLKRLGEKEMLERFLKDIERIKEINYYNEQLPSMTDDKNELATMYNINSREINDVLDKYASYFNKVYVDLSQNELELIECGNLVGTLKRELEVVKSKYEELMLENDKTNKELLIENVRLKEALKDTPEVKRLLELFESNIKSIAVSERMKINKGENKIDNRKKTVNEELLIELYDNGKTTLTNEEIGRRVGLTGNGVRKRLEAIGIYRSKRSDFGINK